MILDQLMRIITEIRRTESCYEMPPYVNFEKELTARAVEDKQKREDAIARELYILVKEYALNHLNGKSIEGYREWKISKE